MVRPILNQRWTVVCPVFFRVVLNMYLFSTQTDVLVSIAFALVYMAAGNTIAQFFHNNCKLARLDKLHQN